MPVFGCCNEGRCQICWTPERQAADAEKRKLAKMTFHERKAYRIARRSGGGAP